MSFLDFRDDYVKAISSTVPERLTVESIGGRIDETELKRLAKKPGIYVAFIAASPGGGANERKRWYTVGMVAFIVAKDNRGVKRADFAISIVDDLVASLDQDSYKLGAGRPQQISAVNLFDDQIDKIGLALWSVSWQQKITRDYANEDAAAALQSITASYFLHPDDDKIADATDDVSFP